MAHENATHPDREIQEDIISVSVLAWLGGVATILTVVTVLVLTGVYYMTRTSLESERHIDADQRMSEIEAQRVIDALVVDGYFEHPGSDDGQGNVTRGTVNIPVATGMQQVIEAAKR